MKAVSTIIIIVLILIVIVSLVSLFWFWSLDLFGSVMEVGTKTVAHTRETLSYCFRIVSIYENKVYIRNCGEEVVKNDSLIVFIDENEFEFEMTPESMDKEEVATIKIYAWGISTGKHTLKIVNPNTEVKEDVEAVLPDSCVLALDFDEGEGNKAYDKSGYGNDGILENQTNGYIIWTNSGYFGGGVYFEGANTNGPMVNLSITQSLNITQPFTITAWINLRDITLDEKPIVVRTGDLGNTGLFVVGGSGQAHVNWGNYSHISRINLYTGTDAVNSYMWQHVAASYDETGLMNIYVNDTIIGQTNKNVTEYEDTLNKRFRIGYFWSGESTFNGTIDSVRIFNQALTPEETIILKTS